MIFMCSGTLSSENSNFYSSKTSWILKLKNLGWRLFDKFIMWSCMRKLVMSVLLLLLSDINFEWAAKIYHSINISSIHHAPSNFKGAARIVSKINTMCNVSKIWPQTENYCIKNTLSKMQTSHIYSCRKYSSSFVICGCIYVSISRVESAVLVHLVGHSQIRLHLKSF